MNISKFPSEITEELAEETGWHIGDGSMNFYNNQGKLKGFYQLRGHIEDDKPHYLERIKLIFKNLYGIDLPLREMPSTRVFGFQIWSNELMKFKQSLGLPLGKKLELEIPKAFFTDNKYLLACIRGIFDTDGCLYLEKKNGKLYPRIQIATISINLANQLINVFSSLGFRATKQIDDYHEEGNRSTSYIIAIRGEEMLHKFFKEVSPKNPKHIKKYEFFMHNQNLKNE